jgi:hypothetical protein
MWCRCTMFDACGNSTPSHAIEALVRFGNCDNSMIWHRRCLESAGGPDDRDSDYSADFRCGLRLWFRHPCTNFGAQTHACEKYSPHVWRSFDALTQLSVLIHGPSSVHNSCERGSGNKVNVRPGLAQTENSIDERCSSKKLADP